MSIGIILLFPELVKLSSITAQDYLYNMFILMFRTSQILSIWDMAIDELARIKLLGTWKLTLPSMHHINLKLHKVFKTFFILESRRRCYCWNLWCCWNAEKSVNWFSKLKSVYYTLRRIFGTILDIYWVVLLPLGNLVLRKLNVAFELSDASDYYYINYYYEREEGGIDWLSVGIQAVG